MCLITLAFATACLYFFEAFLCFMNIHYYFRTVLYCNLPAKQLFQAV